jgi:ssDNA-binding Zn-finger/Zn-ribbon topoisomerase 1
MTDPRDSDVDNSEFLSRDTHTTDCPVCGKEMGKRGLPEHIGDAHGVGASD